MAAFIWVATVSRQWLGMESIQGVCSQRSPKIKWPQRILCFPLKLQSFLSKLTFYIYLCNICLKLFKNVIHQLIQKNSLVLKSSHL